SGERFARDPLDAEIAARDLAAQAGYAYASIRKRSLRCYVETERRGRGDRVGGCDGLRCLRLVLLWLLNEAAELACRLGLRAQAIGRANADGLRLARGLYERGVEAESFLGRCNKVRADGARSVFDRLEQGARLTSAGDSERDEEIYVIGLVGHAALLLTALS